MANAVLQIRTDADIKAKCDTLFKDLGITISDAVNMFLRQCLIHEGIPMEIKRPRPNAETMQALAEAKRLEHDPHKKVYSNFDELLSEVASDV
ncbi:MAG: type II toxin-antitoxin system RelB/DinJ family antitoxin [Fibrobacter sp.]|nr:type II toxin-antitoxin system RelB/DinJ family antitoxin [Fibrobacter sp.]MCQ2120253.1 type II toxin-antitoxin system RelB/DinJ family antitoxin [Fibrobacter sp.]